LDKFYRIFVRLFCWEEGKKLGIGGLVVFLVSFVVLVCELGAVVFLSFFVGFLVGFCYVCFVIYDLLK
jgi:hypothetical protein